jgi:hypothetical protein
MYVEDLLLVMNASRVKKDDFVFGGYRLPLKTFDKAEPLGLPDVTHADVDKAVLTEVTAADLDWRINYTAIAPVNVEQSDMGEHVAVRRYVSVRRPLLPVKTMTRHVVASQRLFINRETGEGRTSVAYFGTNGGDWRNWIDLPRGRRLLDTNPGELAALRMALGMQFSSDYHWHAHLKWSGAEAGVMIPTTPEGARALFRLRDCEPGASRRKALIHWVSEHSRRIRKDTAEETRVWVREHTRGVTKFKWQDMEGAIYPAPFDLRRLEQAQEATR